MDFKFLKKRYRIFIVTAILAVTFAVLYGRFKSEETALPNVDLEGYYLPTAVVYISGDAEDFFGYDNGILVSGRLFDEYKAAQIAAGKLSEEEAAVLEPTELMDANFNHKEWVKKCQVLIKDAAGNILVNDRAGVRISGNASRKLCQKSLCIIADDMYGSKNDAFYLALGEKAFGAYKKLRIHSGGQDIRKSQLKDEMIAAMAKRCGMLPKRETMPALIFINEEFYGAGHIENRMDESFIADTYGLAKKDIELFEGGILEAAAAMGYNAEDYYDFSDKSVRDIFEKKVCTDNFIHYLAFNIAAGNADWPQNNIVMWRYRGEPIEDIPESDGRYRFILSDVDVTFMAEEKPDPFDLLIAEDKNEYFTFIDAVMQYPEYRDAFVNDIMDIMAVCFNEQFVSEQMSGIIAGYGDAFRYAAEHAFSEQQREYLLKHDEEAAILVQRIVTRSQRLCDILYRKYNTGEGYTLVLKAPGEGEIVCGHMRTASGEADIESLRSNNAAVIVEAMNMPHFEAFSVNGERRESINGKIQLSGQDAADGRVVVEVLCIGR